MELGLNETRPPKHDKAFFPTLIEIQNMIQQTEAAVDAGILDKLPTVSLQSSLFSWHFFISN